MFIGLSHAGTFGAVWLALAVVAAMLWRKPLVPALAVAALLLANAASTGIKHAVDRARPPARIEKPEPLVDVPSSPSFPSGHAAMAFAAAAVLAWDRPRLALPLLTLAAAVAFSRLYIGVHYPLDALGGAALGLAVATALVLLAASLRARRRRLR